MLALLATTISIVLTFGTAAIIENHKKKTAKKEMVMMVLNDFDKTIGIVESIDSGLCECMQMMNISQEDLAKFSEQHTSKKADADRAAIKEKLMKEYFEHQEVLNQAREKLNE